MPAFAYKASTLDGKIIEGTMDAPDNGTVALKLQEMGLLPVRVHAGGNKGLLNLEIQFPSRKRRVRPKDVLIFTKEMHTLVKAGFPLDRSLAVLGQLAESPRAQEVILDVLKEVKGGKSFSEGLAKYPEVFPKVYVNMVKAGEAGGALQEILGRLVDFMETSENLRSYVIGALIYPALLGTVGLVSVTILTLFVVPRFAEIFKDMGVAMPIPMVILQAISQVLSGYWWALAAAIALVTVWLRRYRSSAEGRLQLDRWFLRIPLVGNVIRKIEVSRISRTLGTLLHGGVPLLQAMTIVRDIVGNQAIGAVFEPIRNGIKKGEGVSQPMKQSGVFPPLAMHLIEVGEESGKLDVMLGQVADTYDGEVRNAVKNLIAFFEPALIVVMGVIIGTIVVSMLLAIFSINDVPL
jgi:type II secretion system protein F